MPYTIGPGGQINRGPLPQQGGGSYILPNPYGGGNRRPLTPLPARPLSLAGSENPFAELLGSFSNPFAPTGMEGGPAMGMPADITGLPEYGSIAELQADLGNLPMGIGTAISAVAGPLGLLFGGLMGLLGLGESVGMIGLGGTGPGIGTGPGVSAEGTAIGPPATTTPGVDPGAIY